MSFISPEACLQTHIILEDKNCSFRNWMVLFLCHYKNAF